MRGHFEESAEVIAKRELDEAARRFAGFYLVQGFVGPDVEAASNRLAMAALAFAAAVQRPAPKKKAPRTKGASRG